MARTPYVVLFPRLMFSVFMVSSICRLASKDCVVFVFDAATCPMQLYATQCRVDSRRGVREQVQEAGDVTLGGVLLPDSAKEKPIAGTVVRAGPGRREKDGARKAPKVPSLPRLPSVFSCGIHVHTPCERVSLKEIRGRGVILVLIS